jgi:hypothetical protein
MSALFILKRREDYNSDPSYSYSYQIATGMWNSALFVADMLNENGIPANVEMVVDANAIDAVVVQNNPSQVFIEGLWVPPAKFTELMALSHHAGRQWHVRIHSEMPFLATEGVAFEWITAYLTQGVVVAANSPRIHLQLKQWAASAGFSESQIVAQLPLLQNYYPTDYRTIFPGELDFSQKPELDIGCFGALRVLKNTLQQAQIAVEFARSIGKPLRFHVNSLESGPHAGGISKNLESFFAALPPAEAVLVPHGWEDRPTFLQSTQSIDLMMQLSFSETFNIVGADATWVGRPVLGSPELPWLYPLYGDETSSTDAMKSLQTIMSNPSFFVTQNRARLKTYSAGSEIQWVSYCA